MKILMANPSMKRTDPRLLIVIGVLLAIPAGFAQDASHSTAPTQGRAASAPVASQEAKPKTFDELDANKDGKLSKDEVAQDPVWSADFDSADTNKDGYLSAAEFEQHKADLKKANAHTKTKSEDPPALDDSKKKDHGV